MSRALRLEHEAEQEQFQARRQLFGAAGVAVVDFRCRAHVAPAGREEPNPTHSIVFIRRGAFVRVDRDEVLLADPTVILFFNQGQPYRYAHPVAGGDECTILTLDTASALASLECCELGDTGRPEAPFRCGHASSTPRAARLHHELLAHLGGNAPPLVYEDLVAELIGEALRAADRGSPVGQIEPCGVAARRRRDTVEAAKLVLNERVDTPPRLGELATLLGCSPFHLSRIFRRSTGFSLRSYLRRLRTRLAADRLLRGAPDLTALALDLGFSDHSHFTKTFRREWGVPPSRLRAATTERSSTSPGSRSGKNVQAVTSMKP